MGYEVPLTTPKKVTKTKTTKVGKAGQEFTKVTPFYETKEGKAALKETQKILKKSEGPLQKITKK